jgi:hypothetical protein
MRQSFIELLQDWQEFDKALHLYNIHIYVTHCIYPIYVVFWKTYVHRIENKALAIDTADENTIGASVA